MSSIEWDIPFDIEEPEIVPQPIIIDNIEQGSEEWLSLRAGNITGSKISNMMAKGEQKTRNKYKIQMAIERMTGIPVKMDYKSAAMIKGNEDEPLAREYYEFLNDVDARQVTFVYHPTLKNCGVSPDSLIGDDGLLEVKCPNMETHIDYLLTKKIPTGYLLQVNWEMACTGRAWCDWMSYCKELPMHMRSLIIRVHRDEQKIAELERAAQLFNEEVEQLIIKLRTL